MALLPECLGWTLDKDMGQLDKGTMMNQKSLLKVAVAGAIAAVVTQAIAKRL